MINWIQVKLWLLEDSWLQYFHLCSGCVTLRCQRSLWYQRWGGQAASGLLKCFLQLLLLQFIVSETVTLPAVKFSQSKDECECCFLQLSIQHSAISPVSIFHFSFFSTCFVCIMSGWSLFSIVSILGRRQRLPVSSYNTNHQRSPCWFNALGFIPLQTNKQTSKQETSLQMFLSMHPKVPIRIGTFVFSICILALASCIFTASSR